MSRRSKILFVVFLVICVGAISYGIYYVTKQSNAEKVTARLQEIAGISSDDEESPEVEPEQTEEKSETEESEEPEETFTSPINFDALHNENKDIYAWISIDDTVINYPILQSDADDPDYYVDHTVDQAEGLPGAIFTESDMNQEPFEDAVTVIFGHCMRNDSMFGSLDLFTDEEYRNEHSDIVIYTEDHTYTYKIAFVQIYDDRSILDNYYCNDIRGYQAFLDSLESVHSMQYWHSEDIELNVDQKMIVLSTCYGDDRLLVGAVLQNVEG